MRIVSRWDAEKVLFEAEGDTRATVIAAVAGGADLSGADLRGADLRGAYLRWAELRWADLRGAYLRWADLRGADLRGAYLRWAELSRADLRGADLRGAELRGAKVAWTSHAMVSEILRRAAGGVVERLKFAGLIAMQRSWCWGAFLKLNDPVAPWALAELARWIQPDDGHPECLDAYTDKERN